MSKSERRILFYDLKSTAGSRTFDSPTPLAVDRLFKLMELVPIDDRRLELSKKTQTIYVSKWKLAGDDIHILVNRSDQTIPDPIFSVPATNSRRTVEKEGDEGQDFSAHILIRLPSLATDPALMLIEQCPGLSAELIGKLFKAILKLARDLSPTDYVQQHPDGSLDEHGKPRTYNLRFGFTVDGHISPDFAADLNRGRIHSIELITHRKLNTPFDTDGYFTEDMRTVKLVLDSGSVVKNIANSVMSVVQQNKQTYDEAKVRFTAPDGELERTVILDTNGVPDNYVKKEIISGFDTELKSSYEDFNKEILDKMTLIA